MTEPDADFMSWADRRIDDQPVPSVQQQTNYTCGPACLSAALAYFGQHVDEDECSLAAGTTAEGGTDTGGMATAAEKYGLKAEVRAGMGIGDLVDAIDAGKVVIIALQAYNAEQGHDYTDEWQDGHYVIPTSVDPDNGVVTFSDPSSDPEEHGRATLTTEELEERWHDVDDGKAVFGLGIVLTGETPAQYDGPLPTAGTPME